MLYEDLQMIEDHAKSSWALLDGSRMLLTGATGAIGQGLLKAFFHHNQRARKPISVQAVSRTPQRFLAENECFRNLPWLKWMECDLTQGPLLPAGEGFDHVIHAAGLDRGKDEEIHRTNFLATQNLLLHHGHPRRSFLFLSTGAVHSPSGYGRSKKAAEDMILKDTQCPSRIARIYGVIGGDLDLNRHYAITQFAHQALRGETISLRGNGEPRRSYLYMADLVVWLFRALSHGTNQTVYEVGSETGLTLSELAERMASTATEFTHRAPVPVKILGQTTEQGAGADYVPRTLQTRDRLGLREWTPLDEGLRKYFIYQISKQSEMKTKINRLQAGPPQEVQP